MPQKGIVNISKSGEVFFSAVESDGVYSFVLQIKVSQVRSMRLFAIPILFYNFLNFSLDFI